MRGAADVEGELITAQASFADRLSAPLEVEGVGTLTADTAYGGDSFVLVSAARLGFSLAMVLALLIGMTEDQLPLRPGRVDLGDVAVFQIHDVARDLQQRGPPHGQNGRIDSETTRTPS